jgi:hypothetical protein
VFDDLAVIIETEDIDAGPVAVSSPLDNNGSSFARKKRPDHIDLASSRGLIGAGSGSRLTMISVST